MPNIHRPLLLAAVAATVAGCFDQPSGVLPGRPQPPANYHPPTSTPIDPELQAAARAQLRDGLRSPDEVVRTHALEVLADAAPADPAGLVLPLLSDSSVIVRKAAALTAGRLKLAAAHNRLLAMAQDTAAPADPSDQNGPMYAEQARMAAMFGLHELGDTRYSHQFELTALDPRAQVRGDTALMLGLIGDTSAKPILASMLKHDRSQNVRLQAAEALWKMKDETGENFLITATLSGYPSDDILALMALAGPRERKVLGHIQGFLRNDDRPEVTLAAARAAGELQCDWGIGVAEIYAGKGDPTQRGMAALALGDIGRPDAQPTLAKLLSDDEADVRIAAAAALLQLGKK